MAASISEEIRELWNEIKQNRKEIRRLRTWQQRVGSGNALRAGTIIGVVPVGSGGTGGTGGGPGSVALWTNASGGTRSRGDVVVQNGDRTIGVTTTLGDLNVVGIVDDTTIGAAAEGRVRSDGYQSVVAVDGSVSPGDYLVSSTVSGKAESSGPQAAGAFAMALTADAGGACAAYLFAPITWDGHLALEIPFGDGINVIPSGPSTWIEIPYDCDIESWALAADQSGDLSIDVQVAGIGSFPPGLGDSICGGANPALSAEQTHEGTDVSAWSAFLQARDWMLLDVLSAATITQATLSLRVARRARTL